jgi:hypothetical protein
VQDDGYRAVLKEKHFQDENDVSDYYAIDDSRDYTGYTMRGRPA